MVIEDEFLLRMDIVEFLSNEGFEIVACTTADEGAQLLSDGTIDALLTDIQTPGKIDGVALAGLFRDAWPQVFVAIISGNPQPQHLPAMVRFMPKPISDRDLCGLVADLRLWPDKAS